MKQVDPFWNYATGRELDSTLVDGSTIKAPVVACLNVWNDCVALQRTVPTWLKYVDRIIAVDGAYEGTHESLSTDGTREYLQSLPNVTLINGAGLTQCQKRTRYLEEGREGEYLFIVDADESLAENTWPSVLPICDVGWVRIRNDIYTREYGQPRLIRWRPGLAYLGRHHWMYHGQSLFCTHQYGGSGYSHRPVSIVLGNQRKIGRSDEHLSVKRTHASNQLRVEQALCATPRTLMSDSQIGGREALQILNFAYADDGIAPSRFHTAINRTTPHASVMFKGRPGPFDAPMQYCHRLHPGKLSKALSTADILHYHGVMSMAMQNTRAIPTVFHHHGSMYRANFTRYNQSAKMRNALVVLSNLELFSWTDGMTAYFLPNPMPVARYRAIANTLSIPFTGSNPFRIAHSPTKVHRKGTADFLSACARLKARGVPVEPVLIQNMNHRDVIAVKATCHAAFDSFWLGIQCSGLEAASMQLPVIAGDETVASRYVEGFGAVPYTFANSGESLEHTIFKLIDDRTFYIAEAMRVHQYVLDHHDEAAVALTYLDYLDTAFGWRSKKRTALVPTRRFRPGGVRV